MTRIHANMKLSDLVEMNFEIVAVIQRLEIPYGFKEKTVSMVCKENGIDVDFFLQLAQWFNDRHYSPQDHLIEHSPESLIIYLRNTHHCYLTYQIPRIEKEIALLEDYTDLPDHSAKLMIQFFREYIREFSEHIEEEEIWTFPYTIDLISTLKDKMSLDEFHEKYQGYSIASYLENHSDLDEKVYDLRNLLLKHIPPITGNCHFSNLLLELYRLGKDLRDHTILEENVLIPIVQLKEKELLAKLKQL